MSAKIIGGPQLSRRQALASGGSLLTTAMVPTGAMAQGGDDGVLADRPNLAIVSRHLQWTTADHGIEVARAAGFPGIIWTVRSGAHVLPQNVAQELPRIVRQTRDAGLDVPMLITGISSASSAGAEQILATMQELGITLYRAGAPRYDYNRPLADQFAAFRQSMEELAILNERYGTTAAFHTHSYANSIGGGGWDMFVAQHSLNPRFIGVNFDIGHVMAKGGASWRESIRAIGPHLHSVSIKDFAWVRVTDGPEGEWPWRTRFVVPGEGMVNYLDFFRHLQSVNFRGPLETYYEYTVPTANGQRMNMLGTDIGDWQLEIPESQFIALLARDVAFYNEVWRQARARPIAPAYSLNADG